MNIVEGKYFGENKRVALVASRFNSFVVERLIEGALDALKRHGLEEKNVTLYRIPGAFEFPAFISQLTKPSAKNALDGIICLGAVIRGETPHFDFVANEAIKGISQISMNASFPIMMGILTTETLEQAINRAGAKSGNKGFEVALALLEMMDLYKQI